MERGLVRFDENDDGVGITALGDESQLWPDHSSSATSTSPLEPLFASTSWTREDVRTISSLATLLVATIVLLEVYRG